MGGQKECHWGRGRLGQQAARAMGLSGREGRAKAAGARGTDKPLGPWGHIRYKKVKNSVRAKGFQGVRKQAARAMGPRSLPFRFSVSFPDLSREEGGLPQWLWGIPG